MRRAVKGLIGTHFNILTMHGHSGLVGLNISLSAPEIPYKHVALKIEKDVKDDQVEKPSI